MADVQSALSSILVQHSRLEQAYGPAVNWLLPEDAQTARLKLFEAVKETFTAAGFKPSEYKPKRARPLPKVPDVQIVPLEVPGKCNLAQLLKSINGLRKAKTFVFVDSFRITNDEKKPGTFTVTIVVATLARIPKASL